MSTSGRNIDEKILKGVVKIERSSLTATIGTLIIKSYTTAERDNLTAQSGMLIFNSTTNKLNIYTGSVWEQITSA
jgi:hypothetical protein